MYFSILFATTEQADRPRRTTAPACFHDLNLDQIIDPILQSKKGYELDDFFYTSLQEDAEIVYRQDVLREFEDEQLCDLLTTFSQTIYSIGGLMRSVREKLSSQGSWDNNYLTRGRMLNCAERYCAAVSTLEKELMPWTFHAAGLSIFKKYLQEYCYSSEFTGLQRMAVTLRAQFDDLQYCMLIKNGTIKVRKYEGQKNLSSQVVSLFEKFRQGDCKDYRHKLSEEPAAEHVEVAVLALLAKTYPEPFQELDSFCEKFFHFEDETLLQFSREIQFYLSWMELIHPIRAAGLPFCYPAMSKSADEICDLDGYDLALARKIGKTTVTNDFSIRSPERILVVTGPNQGGKTTYARALGQIHYLASLGVCVPGREASLFLCDRILTHFGREEDLSTQNGKLQDDLMRLHELLGEATKQSLIIVNEIFSSTTLADALLLGNRMMDAFTNLGAPCVIVTFLDELASHGAETVSLMSTVLPDDPSQRTYQIVRKPPDGLAYAMYIAGKHRLTYEQLSRRLAK
jgi:hypothetical protein